MSHYSHLTLVERYQIYALLKIDTPIATIARVLLKHRSTIYREIRRNKGRRNYRPQQAQAFADKRHAENQPRLQDFFFAYVDHLLACFWSPEQIHGRLIRLGWDDVGSVQTIYEYIARNKAHGGELYRALRVKKAYRKRGYQDSDGRGQLSERRDIDERPSLVESRERLGDIEGDTIIGKGHKGAIVTLVDRAIRLTRMKGLSNRKSEKVSQAVIELLSGAEPKTITFDNGKEFAGHQEIAKSLSADVYFAKPHSPWQRGTNENTNGLIRQFFDKSRRLDDIKDEEIRCVESLLNNRPRKTLGYLTPLEALANFTVALYSGI